MAISQRVRGRTGVVVAIAVGLVALALLYWRLSLTHIVDSDGALGVLLGKAVLDGNLLLSGWTLPDDTFYTSDVPFYVLAVALRGVSVGVVHGVVALIYAMTVVTACLLARSRASSRNWLRMLVTLGLLVAPAGVGVQMLLVEALHVGTALFLLVGLLALDYDRDRSSWWALTVFGLLFLLATAGDPLAFATGGVAVVAVCVIRLLFATARTWRSDAALLAVTAVAGAAGTVLRDMVSSAGGYTLEHVSSSFAALTDIPHHVQLALEGWLQVYGADFFGRPLGLGTAVEMVRAVGCVFVVVALLVALARLRRGTFVDRTTQILVAVVVVDVAAFILSTQPVDIWSTRYLLPGIFAGAILAGRVGVDLLTNARLRAVAAGIAIVYVALLFVGVRTPPHVQPEGQLAAWLDSHGLRYGLGSYWDASIVTVTSGDKVRVRAIEPAGTGRLAPYEHDAQGAWYDPGHPGNDARFVVLDPDQPSVTQRNVSATFGHPTEVHRVGRYTVLVWNHNLLRDLAS